MSTLTAPAPARLSCGYARNATMAAHRSLWKGLVGYWSPRMGVQGQQLFDFSNSRNKAVLNAMSQADWVGGKFGNSLSYNGSTKYLNVTSAGNQNFSTTTPFSMATWVDLVTGATLPESVLNKGNLANVSGGAWHFGIQSASPFNCIFRLSTVSNTVAAQVAFGSDIRGLGATHLAVVVRRNSTALAATDFDCYVNGLLQTGTVTATASGTTNMDASSTDDLRIGCRLNTSNTAFWNGKISDVGLWSRELTKKEVKILYLGGSPLMRGEY